MQRAAPIIIAFGLFISCAQNESSVASTEIFDYNPERILKAMFKAQRGEVITIAAIGGSITAGHAASAENLRWPNRVETWWKTNFPQTQVTLINAGLGGTGSDIGAHRVSADVLAYQPDLVVIEFAVNDVDGTQTEKTFEGLVRQILATNKNPGVIVLALKQQNGVTAQASHKKIADHYGLPVISFTDLIDAQLARDGKTLSSIFVDGLHPNDSGMYYIARFITNELARIKQLLQSSSESQILGQPLPPPLVSATFAGTASYSPSNLLPVQNSGWNMSIDGWHSDSVDSEIVFEVTGTAISIVYSQYFSANRGRALVWVDDLPAIPIDAFFLEDWGPAQRFLLVAENLQSGPHMLHLRILSDTTPGNGNFFPLHQVLTAGLGSN